MPNTPPPTIFPAMSDITVGSATITPVVNGEARSVRAGSTMGDLLRTLALDPQLVVVEHNRTILRDRAQYDALRLATGDIIEIVHFVGGG